MKKVIFVADWLDVERACSNAESRDVVIFLSQVSPSWLEGVRDRYRGIRICGCNEYIGWQEELALREEASRIYNQLIDISISYRGVAFADLFIPLYIYINNIIFHIYLYDRVTELERPQRYIGIGTSDETSTLQIIHNERCCVEWQTLYPGNNRDGRLKQIYSRVTSLNELYEYLMMRYVVWRREVRKGFINTDKENKPDIGVIVGYNISYLEPVLPVLNALRNQGNNIHILAEGYFVKKRLKKEKIKFYTIQDFVGSADNCISRQEAVSKINDWLDTADGDTLLYRGLNIWHALKKARPFKSICNLRFPSLYPILDGLERFFAKINPEALIVGTDRPFLERAGVRLANIHRIPSLHLQHGLVGYASFRDPIASKVCVWGDVFRERVIRFGCQKDRVEVTGAPSLDGLDVSSHEIETFYAKTGMSSSARIIAWFTTPLNRSVFRIDHALLSNEIMISLLDILKKKEDAVLLIKLHPLDRAAIYTDIIKGQRFLLKKRIIIKQDVDPAVVMRVARVGIIIQSTLIVDSVRTGLPVVKVGWLNIEGDEFFTDNNLVYNARTLDEFSAYIDNMLDGCPSGARQAPAIFKEIVSSFGSDAVANVVEVLNSIRKG